MSCSGSGDKSEVCVEFKQPNDEQEQLFALSHPMDYYRVHRWTWFLLPSDEKAVIDWAKAWCNKNCTDEWTSSPATQKGLFGLQVFCFESSKEASDAFKYLRSYLVHCEAEQGNVKAMKIRGKARL